MDDYIKTDNVWVKTGYRIGFNTYYDCAISIFMIHNETVNIWTHMIGCLCFVVLIFYFMIEIVPTSLHESKNLPMRWTSDFDVGKFDDLYCDRDDFVFPNPN